MAFTRQLSSLAAILYSYQQATLLAAGGPHPALLKKDLGGQHSVHCSTISDDVGVKHGGWSQSPGEGIRNQNKSPGVRWSHSVGV